VLKLLKREVNMSTVLYKLVNGKPESELVDALDVDRLLKDGYATTAKGLVSANKADTNNSGKLSSAEVKAAAESAGLTIKNKTIKQLKKELGYE
jgi:hypothetical protein